MGIISEPTAAALAYGLHKRDNVNNVVVVDFGVFHRSLLLKSNRWWDIGCINFMATKWHVCNTCISWQ